MSHYTVLICIDPDDDGNIDFSRVESLLAPYDENKDVEPYETECACVGLDARIDSNKAAEIALGYTVDDIRNVYRDMPEVMKTDAMWESLLSETHSKREELLKAHPLYEKPTPDCDECNGTGKEERELAE